MRLTRDAAPGWARATLAPALALLGLWLPCAGGFACEEELFSARNRTAEKMLIHWEPVHDVTATCNEERRKRGKPPYGPSVLACAFWDHDPGDSRCRIYTSLDTSIESLGHELRHCFQGAFHY
jgi:hypothetical protein